MKRGEFLDEVMATLNTFSNQATLLERWLSEILEALDTRNLPDNYARLEELCTKRDAKREPFEETVRNGRGLVSKKDVTDTGPVRDRIKVNFCGIAAHLEKSGHFFSMEKSGNFHVSRVENMYQPKIT